MRAVSSSRTETTVQVTMPQMGVSVTEGTIVEWRKRPGDWIEADEMVCDITTDKIDVEVPSPASGRLSKILAEPGTTIPVGEPIAEIDTGARPGEAHPEEDSAGANGEARPEAAAGGEATAGGEAVAEGEVPDRSRFYSPVVRRIAEKHGVDLERVEGTGIGGRVRKRDLVAFIERSGEPSVEKPPEPVLHSESPYRPEEPATKRPEPSATDGEPVAAEGERREPMSEMRKAIARHMVESRRTAAHATTIVEADFASVAARRKELRETMRRRGINLTYLAFVARATVETLEEFPRLNASLDGDELVLHDDVNLGIAVALEGGLIVPVIKQAQRLSLEGLAAAIGDVAERARERRLEPDDVHGGTFTITNPGQFGAVLATPIINQPQVAILDLEAIVKRPVVVGGADGEDAIAIRPMSYFCMSWDHRALDGADAARFLARVKERIEGWEAEQ
jgi:2-oxoglutarate dehydrogenase dihydrolipoamide succinyltransferase (E2 component)